MYINITDGMSRRDMERGNLDFMIEVTPRSEGAWATQPKEEGGKTEGSKVKKELKLSFQILRIRFLYIIFGMTGQ